MPRLPPRPLCQHFSLPTNSTTSSVLRGPVLQKRLYLHGCLSANGPPRGGGGGHGRPRGRRPLPCHDLCDHRPPSHLGLLRGYVEPRPGLVADLVDGRAPLADNGPGRHVRDRDLGDKVVRRPPHLRLGGLAAVHRRLRCLLQRLLGDVIKDEPLAFRHRLQRARQQNHPLLRAREKLVGARQLDPRARSVLQGADLRAALADDGPRILVVHQQFQCDVVHGASHAPRVSCHLLVTLIFHLFLALLPSARARSLVNRARIALFKKVVRVLCAWS